MRTIVWMALLLGLTSTVSASIYNIVTDDTVLTDNFAFSDLASGAGSCSVELTYYHDGNQFTQTQSAWPRGSHATCYELLDKEYQYGKGSGDPKAKVKITQADNAQLNPDLIPVFLGVQRGQGLNSSNLVGQAPEILVGELAPGDFDNFPPSGNIDFFHLVWCGELLDGLRFDTNTVSPTALTKASYSSKQYCTNFYERTGGTLTFTDGAYSTAAGLTRAFTLPFKRKCEGYEVTFTDGNNRDWPINVPQAMQKTTAGYALNVKGIEDANTEAVFLLETDSTTEQVTAIQILLDDTGPEGGSAAAITITCVNPIEPDDDSDTCELLADGVWDDSVATAAPGAACCGDDGTADLGARGGMLCVQDAASGDYSWNSLGTLCHYPQNWAIGTLTQSAIDLDAQGTLLPLASATAPADCCSNSTNHGRRVTIPGQDEFLCSVGSDNRAQWLSASQTKTPITFTLKDTNTPYELLSDGVSFATCNSNLYSTTVTSVIPPQRIAGAANQVCP